MTGPGRPGLVEPGDANAEMEKVLLLAAYKGEVGFATGVNLGRSAGVAGQLPLRGFADDASMLGARAVDRDGDADHDVEEQIAKIRGCSRAGVPAGDARPVQPVGHRTVVVDAGSDPERDPACALMAEPARDTLKVSSPPPEASTLPSPPGPAPHPR
jgi:hypothetical protein